MNEAEQIVNLLLETRMIRVCSQCQADRMARGLPPVEIPPGGSMTNGMCRRHTLQYFQDNGLMDRIAVINGMPDEKFCPDLEAEPARQPPESVLPAVCRT